MLAGFEKQALTNRPDLKRIAAEEAAQRQSVAMAKSVLRAASECICRMGNGQPHVRCRRRGNNWLGGIEVQFDIFSRRRQAGANYPRQRALEEK